MSDKVSDESNQPDALPTRRAADAPVAEAVEKPPAPDLAARGSNTAIGEMRGSRGPGSESDKSGDAINKAVERLKNEGLGTGKGRNPGPLANQFDELRKLSEPIDIAKILNDKDEEEAVGQAATDDGSGGTQNENKPGSSPDAGSQELDSAGKAGDNNTKPSAANIEALNIYSFGEYALTLFDKLNKDGNDVISFSELSKAIQDEKYSGQDAQALATMYKHFSTISGFSNDHWGPDSFGKVTKAMEGRGITKADLQAMSKFTEEHRNKYLQGMAIQQWAKSGKFESLSGTGDGKVTFSDLHTAHNNPNLDKESREAIRKILAQYTALHKASGEAFLPGEPLTIKHLENMPKVLAEPDEYSKKKFSFIQDFYRTTLDVHAIQSSNASRSLFASGDNPLQSIKPDAVKQGSLGNCYFHAALASVANTNPELIRDMIKENQDGTYTVTFPGAKNEPITISKPSEAEVGLYSRGSEHGLWPAVLEKAYGKYIQDSVWRRSPFNPLGGNLHVEGSDGGGFPERALNLLTGESNMTWRLAISNQKLISEALDNAVNGNPPRPVTASILGGIPLRTTDGFYKFHAYSITAFDPKGPDGGTVTIRNPWGYGDNSTAGTIKISVKKFMANFSEMSFNNKRR